MGDFFRKNIVTVIIIGATLVLAGVAVFTAFRLYQLRQQPITPTAPTSKPGAQVASNCTLTFTLTEASASPSASPTATPSASPSASPIASPTPSPTPLSCNTTCSVTSDCTSGLTCSDGKCRNAQCSAETDCICPVTAASSTPAPELPDAGVSLPTLLGGAAGILLILGAFLLAL